MKKMLSVILACALLGMSLAGCGSKRTSAQETVEAGIQAVKVFDQEAIRSYWGDDALKNSESDEDDAQSIELMKTIMASMTYEVKDAVEDAKAGTATVTVAFTNVDMAIVMQAYLSEMFTLVMEYAFLPEDQQPSEEELNELYMEKFNELVSSETNEKVTTSVDIDLSLVEDKWVMGTSEGAIDAMFGGMITAADALSAAGTP